MKKRRRIEKQSLRIRRGAEARPPSNDCHLLLSKSIDPDPCGNGTFSPEIPLLLLILLKREKRENDKIEKNEDSMFLSSFFCFCHAMGGMYLFVIFYILHQKKMAL